MAIDGKTLEQKIELLMKNLECSREDALDILETDKIIDKGGRTQYDLSKEQEKLAMKISGVKDRRAKDQESNQRGKVRAENPTKSGIISEIAEYLKENCSFACENVEITNKERQIAFSVGENKYEFTLVQKRTPKK
jgi:single-stranded DNA-specific DHH superfamily exonuclease